MSSRFGARMPTSDDPGDDRCVSVRAPARLHMGFVDLHGGEGRRYGSLGLALEGPFTRVRLSRDSGVAAEGPDAARAARYATSIVERFDLREGVRIDVEEAIAPHAGLGSGTQLALAVGAGMAKLFDLDMRTVEIAAVLDRGNRSGLGIGLFDHGGFVVDGGSAGDGVPPPVIARQPFPSQWRLLLVFDRGRQGPCGEAEIEKFAALLEFPEADAAELCRLVLMCALPGVVQADLDAFGDAVGRIQARVGDHFAGVQGGRFASPGVSRVLEWLGSRGLKAVGQSSWGPTGFAVCPSEATANRLKGEAEIRFGREFGLDFAVTRARNPRRGCREHSPGALTSEAATSDRQSVLGASSWHKPPGDAIPVAASYLHAGNHFRKLGSPVKIDAAQGF